MSYMDDATYKMLMKERMLSLHIQEEEEEAKLAKREVDFEKKARSVAMDIEDINDSIKEVDQIISDAKSRGSWVVVNDNVAENAAGSSSSSSTWTKKSIVERVGEVVALSAVQSSEAKKKPSPSVEDWEVVARELKWE